MNTSFRWLSCLLLILLVSGCSKERQIKRLLKNHQDWNVETITWVRTAVDVDEILDEDDFFYNTLSVGTLNDAGTMSFYRKDEGHAEFDFDEFNKDRAFTWEVLNEETVRVWERSSSILSNIVGAVNSISNDEEVIWNYESSNFEYDMEMISEEEFHVNGEGSISIINSEDDFSYDVYLYDISMVLKK